MNFGFHGLRPAGLSRRKIEEKSEEKDAKRVRIIDDFPLRSKGLCPHPWLHSGLCSQLWQLVTTF
jgi:hypothetical protein